MGKEAVASEEKEQIVVQVDNKIVGQEENVKLIDLAVEMNESVLLIGDTGVGKTSLIRNLAKDKGIHSIRFNLTGETTVDEFVGKYTLVKGETVWVDGVLLKAMKMGWWLICDEINAALPEILFVLHSLLDDDRHVMVANHAGEIVKPHPEFRFFATMNPVDEYAGTKELNKAFKSRFGMILIIMTPNNDLEVQLIQDRCGVSLEDARKIVIVANKLRDMKKNQEIFLTTSTRDLIQWGSLSLKTDLGTAFGVTILNKSDSEDERKLIVEALRNLLNDIQQIQQASPTLDPQKLKEESKKIQQMMDKMEDRKREMEQAQQDLESIQNEAKDKAKQELREEIEEQIRKEQQDNGKKSSKKPRPSEDSSKQEGSDSGSEPKDDQSTSSESNESKTGSQEETEGNDLGDQFRNLLSRAGDGDNETKEKNDKNNTGKTFNVATLE